MAELKSSYDVVIVGNDLPALIFGALAAKNGYRVLVLGHGGRPNIYEMDGFRFVRRPNLLYGFSEAHNIREVFRDLALLPEMRNMPHPFDPVCDVVLPERRIELSHVRGIIEEEIEREFPGQIGLFSRYFQDQAELEQRLDPLMKTLPPIPPSGIMECFRWSSIRRTIGSAIPPGDALADFDMNPAARAMIAAPVSVLNLCPDAWKYPLTFSRTTNHLLRGLYNVEWGLDSLKNLFVSRIEGNSGTVRMAEYADQFDYSRGRVHSIDVRGRNEAVGASLLVSGTDLAEIVRMLPEKVVRKRHMQRIRDYAPSHFLVTMNIGMARRGIPTGMARTVFLVDDPTSPMEGTNCLTLQVDPAMEPADMMDPERTTLSVSGMIPASILDEGAGSIEAFGEQMMEKVRAFMPFLDRHLITTSLAATRISEKTGRSVPDAAGMIPACTRMYPRTFGMIGQPVRTPWKNIFNLGDATIGTMGFEGAFSVAAMAFNLIKKMLPKKDDFSHSRGI